MNIAVIGMGYVGLVTGAVFADLGNDVIGVDKDSGRVAMLQQGKLPIYEPGLEEVVNHNLSEGRLQFTQDILKAVSVSDVVFVCVGTPPRETGESDLSQVEGAAKAIAEALNGYKIVVNKSTVPVGTGDFVRDVICRHRKKEVEFDVVSNPEFLREGSALTDTLYPERIVIGASSQTAAMRIVELYAPLERPMLITDVYSAEMIKYSSNAFLSMKISFMNAIANICEAVGADVTQVAKGMGYDSRIGSAFLGAGLGYGGSCFGKDCHSLVHTAGRYGYDFKLLKDSIRINEERAVRLVDRMEEEMGSLKGASVGIMGLAFKPNTDDMRDAKSVEIIRELIERGAQVKAYDPVATQNARAILPDIAYCKNAYEVAEGSDALILVTEWNEFKQLNLKRIRETMNKPFFFDGRNLYEPARMKRMGFCYHGIGRKNGNGNGNGLFHGK